MVGLPSFSIQAYKKAFANDVTSYARKNIYSRHTRGSIKPLLHLMVLAGVGGYMLEYYAAGQYHIAHDKHDKARAMELLKREKESGTSHH